MDPQMQMLAVAREMKEVPELPSEAPKDVSALLKVEFPPEGGALTYIEGHEEPYKGYPFYEFVDKIDTLKKMGRGTLSYLFHALKKKSKLQLATVLLVPWLFSALAGAAVYAAHRVVVRFRFKSHRYCTAMRELWRAFGKNERLRDIVCMVLENDNAYRYRFQDIIVELDKVSLRKNPGREIVRLLNVLQSRETHEDLVDTWTLLKTFIPPFLFINRRIRSEVVRVLTDLDLEKVALSKEDKWYATPRKDYVCGFRTNPTPEDSAIIARVDAKTTRDELKMAVREESTKAHETLFARQLAEISLSEAEREEMKKADESLGEQLSKEGSQAFELGRVETRKRILGDRFPLMQKHLAEVAALDKEFNDKLQAIT